MSNLPARRKADILAKVKKSKLKSPAVSKQKTPKLSRQQLVETIKKTGLSRLLFAQDATASREHSWTVAKEITEAMFDVVPQELEISLAYHGGSRVREITSFTTDKTKFATKIRSVRCLAGRTALNQILESAVGINRLKVIIYIGDCYEENLAAATETARHLALKGVKIFFFHESEDNLSLENRHLDPAWNAFNTLAKISGGAVFPFDSNSPQVVKLLLEAIAYYASRGLKALKQLDTPAARKLLQAIEHSAE